MPLITSNYSNHDPSNGAAHATSDGAAHAASYCAAHAAPHTAPDGSTDSIADSKSITYSIVHHFTCTKPCAYLASHGIGVFGTAHCGGHTHS